MKGKFALALFVGLTVAAFAQTPLGTYKGKVKMDPGFLPKTHNAQEKAKQDKMVKEFVAMIPTLVIKSNKTFRLSSPAVGKNPARHSEGKWVLKGNRITLITLTTDDGKNSNDKPVSGTVSPDAKTITLDRDKGDAYTIVFSK